MFGSLKTQWLMLLALTICAGIHRISAAPARHHFSKRLDAIASVKQTSVFKTFAMFSSIAYCFSRPWKCGPYCRSYPNTTVYGAFDEFFASDQAGYVAYSADIGSIVVSLRGTLSIQNVIEDAKFIPTNYTPVAGAKIHAGFYKNFMAIQPNVTEFLLAAVKDHPKAPIVFTGHSMGGAAAILSVLDLFQKGLIKKSNVKIYTYGEPRIGNSVFADYVDKTGLKFFRLTHSGDIVPHLPPTFLGYRHHKGEFWIHPDDSTTSICKGQEDSSCSASTGPLNNTLIPHLLYYVPINYCFYDL